MTDTGLVEAVRTPAGEVLGPENKTLIPIRPAGIHSLDAKEARAAIPEGSPLWETAGSAEEYAKKSHADNTVSSYESDWKHFSAWCDTNHVNSMPTTPYIVSLYITDLANGWNGEPQRKVATIVRRLAAINAYHKRAGRFLPASQKYPEISLVLQGIKRKHGTAQEGKRPISIKMADKMLDHGENPVAAARDKAILFLGLSGAFRRSELVGICVEHLVWHANGLTIKIPFSKTDQIGAGREVEIPYGSTPERCPVTAVRDWIDVSGNPKTGPLLRPVDRWGRVRPNAMNAESVSYVIKKRAADAGYNPKDYAGHSLRAGFVTAAAAGGASNRQIMQQTGHKTEKMVNRYARREQLDRREAAAKVGF